MSSARAALLLLAVGSLLAAVLPGCAVPGPGLPAAERGRRLAERTGCFACHGPEGARGAGNPGRPERRVPGYGDEIMMYAKSVGEIREWIRDGSTAAKRASQTWRAERERGALRMPAFGRRLSPAQIEDLTAFVAAVSGMREPADSLARAGLARAGQLGCTGCHGAGGRLARPNPGSLRGFVPPWDGPDFPELVRGRGEFEEWVGHGVTKRFEGNPLARWFLRRATLHMPAFERQLAPGDLDVLWAYVSWLRSPAARADSAAARQARAASAGAGTS